MAIKMTPSRRSQLVEQLLKQNEEQFAQNPQSWGETVAKMLAMGIRQGQANKLSEVEAGAEKTQNANTANLANQIMGGGALDFQGQPIMQDAVDFQGRRIQGQQTQQPGNMRDAVTQTLKGDPQNPLALAALQNAMKAQDPADYSVSKVPLVLTEDVKGVGRAGKEVMGYTRANPRTGQLQYFVGSQEVPGTSVRQQETRTATRDATPRLTSSQEGNELLDLGKKNQTAYKIEELLKYDPTDFLTVGSKFNIFKGNLKDKMNLPFWELTAEEQRYLAEAQRFNGMTSQLFQAIRTEVTGAQAAMVELKYLEAAYLSGKMGPTQYKSALMLLQDMNELAMEIKTNLVSEGYGAVDPRSGEMDTAALQAEFARRFNEQWEPGKAYEIIEPEEAVDEQPGDDIPTGVDPEDWKYMTEEQKALWR